jgi:Ca2+-binding EF-hand superfamily protein
MIDDPDQPGSGDKGRHRMKTLFLAAALSGSIFAGVAGTAAVAQRGGGGMMASADANGDGIITHEEFAAQAAQRFQRLDANNDGKLSGDELRGRMAERAQGGVITKAQFMAESDERFQKMDANHDGRITQDEMQAMMQAFRDRREQTGSQPAGDRNMASPPPGAPRGEERLERIDTNHDGRISREEMRAASDRRFDKMDANHDGFIDQAEMDAGRPPMRGGDMPPPPGAGAPDRDAGQ